MWKHNRPYHKIIAQGLALVILGLCVWWVNRYATTHELVTQIAETYGYAGVFVAAVISGFNLVVPLPVVTFLPFFVDIGLNSPLLIVLIACGMTVGDIVGYWLGYLGREAFSTGMNRVHQKLEQTSAKFAYIFLFFYVAFAPLPNEIVVIPMAALGFRFRYMVVTLLLGNLVFNMLAGKSILAVFQVL